MRTIQSAILFLLLSCCFQCVAQSKEEKADSLKSVLRKANTDDEKYELNIQLADLYALRFTDSLNTMKHVQACIELGEKHDNEKWKVRALRYIGILNVGLRHYQEAREILDSIVHYARSLDYPEAEANAYNNLGASYKISGNPKKALSYQEQALEIHLRINNNKGLALTYLNLGMIHQELGNPEETIENLKLAVEIREKMGNPTGVADVELSIGNYYYYLGELDQALSYWQKAENTYLNANALYGLSLVRNNMGVVYEKKGDYYRALTYYLKNLAYAKQSFNNTAQLNILGNVGIIYQNLEEYKKAFANFQQQLELARNTPDSTFIAHAHANIGQLYHIQSRDSLAH